MTKDDIGIRYLHAEGRDVELPVSPLVFQPETRTLEISRLAVNRQQLAREGDHRAAVQALVTAGDGASGRAIRDAMGSGWNDTRKMEILRAIVTEGYAHAVAQGQGKATEHSITDKGRSFLNGG